MATYRAAPSFCCHGPSRVFRDAGKALEYARRSAGQLHLSYEVWRCEGGRFQLLRRFPAVPRRP